MCERDTLALKPFEISAINWPELNHRILICIPGRTLPKWRQTRWFTFDSQRITESKPSVDIALINRSLITKIFHPKYQILSLSWRKSVKSCQRKRTNLKFVTKFITKSRFLLKTPCISIYRIDQVCTPHFEGTFRFVLEIKNSVSSCRDRMSMAIFPAKLYGVTSMFQTVSGRKNRLFNETRKSRSSIKYSSKRRTLNTSR